MPTPAPAQPWAPYDALLLVSFGGPEGPGDVLPFLRNVTRGRGIPDERLAEVAEHYYHFGGISPLKKVMDFAAQYQIKSGFHGPTDISPVGFAAQLHVGLAIHNYGIQEYMQHSDKTNEVFEQSMTFADGYLHPGDKPGIGVEFNEEAAAAYPYQQAYLPYNRLVDGTVHDW